MRTNRIFGNFLALTFNVLLLSLPCIARAATYANAATTFNWIDATTHSQVGYNTTPYKFNGSISSTCGTVPPIIDDTISDVIPIGFNFVFGDKAFDAIRIMSNGRIQFVSTTLPWDNTTCGYGSPVTQLGYPNSSLNYTMRIYGNDMDPTLRSEIAGGYNTNCTSRTGSNACFVSVATLGTSPNRQFVVTWNNVPEWTNTNTASGSYNIQIILQENGEFIYQYGTDVAGPQANLGQVGWQISTSDYDAPAVGYPVPNTAIRFFVPHPVVEYLMEQSSWTGPGQILDTSGNSRNGSPVGQAQSTGAGRVCRGASIPKTGSNAINTGISVPTTIGNAGTIAFWYKANTAWSGASTQDAQLFDATIANNQWFFLVRRGGTTANGGGRLRFVVTDNTNTVRIAETSAITVSAGTWKHIAVTWSFNNITGGNNDRLTIYVNGVQQQQLSFTSTTATLSSQIGSLYIGDNRSAFVGQNGTSNAADATIDEFRAYNYEASQTTVSQIMNQNSGGCLDHYAVSNSGTGLTCQLSQITISPHTVSHTAYTNNALVTLSTSDGTGTWSLINGHGTLTQNTIDSGTATYLFNNETQVVLGLTHPSAGTIISNVTDGIYFDQENTALAITNCAPGKFNACEFKTTRCTPTSGSTAYANLYTKLADTAFTLDMVAVKSNGTLDNSFSGSVAVSLLANINAPTINASTNCPSAQTATISLGSVTLTNGRPSSSGIAVAANAIKSVAPNYSAYRDVRVKFVYSGNTYCATDAFTVRPQYFTVSATSANADVNNGSDASATPTIKAGTAFTLKADTATPGYDGTPNLDATQAEWPTGPSGSTPGTLAGSFSNATLSSGNGAAASVTYSEVGYFRLASGAIYDASYAGISGDAGNGDCIANSFSNTKDATGRIGCLIANTNATGYIGRFIPDHFAITKGTAVPGCVTAAFTYFGQDGFTTPFTLTAQNASNGTTTNYNGSFAKLALNNWNNFAFTATPALPAGATLTASTTAPTGSWNTGSASVSAKHQISRPAALAGETSVTVQAQPIDSDGVTAALSAVQDAATNLRYGRVRMQNANGSELLDLRVPLRAEYWTGNTDGWQPNALDTCSKTTLSFTKVGSGSDITGKTCVLDSGSPGASGKGCAATAGNVTKQFLESGVTAGSRTFAGDFSLWLKAPGAGNNGALTIDASVDPWLQFNWTGAGLANPSARATFGVAKSGHVIHRREMY